MLDKFSKSSNKGSILFVIYLLYTHYNSVFLKYFFNVFLAANLSTLPFFAFADESSKNVRSGFFFGIDTGYTIGFERNYESNNQGNQNNLTNTSKISYAPQYLNIGAKFGYNHYFSDRFGIRGYVDYIYGVNSIRNTA